MKPEIFEEEFYVNYCKICGNEIDVEYTYCRDCQYDKCSCGKRKKREYEFCKSCFDKSVLEKKEKNGFDKCPLCGNVFFFSEFLETAIENNKTRLVANLITHYRHEHQSSWNRSCHYVSFKYGEIAYENSKIEHNNRAKRQIIRKAKDWLVANEINRDDLLELKDNDHKTINLIKLNFPEINSEQ